MAGQEVIVSSRQGKVKGLVKQDLNGRDYSSFNGIPYAEPPVGELRFKPPVPLKTWGDQVWDATYCRDDSIQEPLFEELKLIGSEDCLYLNVYSPNVKPKKLLPVMVWIHGGGFMVGSSYPKEYRPEFLVSKDVVLVIPTYRLSVFGFLKLNDPKLGVTGNQGLKDQAEALRWVQSSINNFGGDPDNVTIFGESAGGACVQYHMLSPLTKGLFHKAIAQSGNALDPWALAPYETTLEKLGCLAKTDEEKVKFLQNTDTKDLFGAAQRIFEDVCKNEKLYAAEFIGGSVPTIEPKHPGAYLSEHPKEILKRGEFHKVPIIFGFNKDEGFCFLAKIGNLPQPQEHWTIRDLAKEVNYDKNKVGALDKKIQEFYFGSKDPLSKEATPDLAQHKSDAAFNYGAIQTARFIAAKKESPLYFYNFTVVTEANYMRNAEKELQPSEDNKPEQLCLHADELSYLFPNDTIPQELFAPDSIAKKIKDSMLTLWTNFAKFSDPTKSDENGVLNGFIWKPVDGKNLVENKDLNYAEISNDGLAMKVNPFEKRIGFWDSLYDFVNKDN